MREQPAPAVPNELDANPITVTRTLQESLDSETLARAAAQAAVDKKALDVIIIDARKHANYCDFLVIATGRNDRHVLAVAQGVDEVLAPECLALGREGLSKGQWVLLDYGEVIVHVFYQPIRESYDLEGLWQSVPRLAFDIPEELKSRPEGYSLPGVEATPEDEPW
ncbi:MAG: ribosome silencing factor [Myxococcota bacterium]|jgi:ribosome-associated protein|nr:ribosome silencing factor [Myxococcota bacterium]